MNEMIKHWLYYLDFQEVAKKYGQVPISYLSLDVGN